MQTTDAVSPARTGTSQPSDTTVEDQAATRMGWSLAFIDPKLERAFALSAAASNGKVTRLILIVAYFCTAAGMVWGFYTGYWGVWNRMAAGFAIPSALVPPLALLFITKTKTGRRYEAELAATCWFFFFSVIVGFFFFPYMIRYAPGRARVRCALRR